MGVSNTFNYFLTHLGCNFELKATLKGVILQPICVFSKYVMDVE